MEKIPEPGIRKEGPSDTVEEAFLRAGATVIEVAPVIRNFEKEAASLVPSVVKQRPPPKKKVQKAYDNVDVKVEEHKSFATIVEDVDDEDSVRGRRPGVLEKKTPVVPEQTPVVTETSLKRSLELEEKIEVESVPTRAPPKRRRMVNAAPDV